MGICKTKISPANNVSFDIQEEFERHCEYTKINVKHLMKKFIT
jgi:hypothetical protein